LERRTTVLISIIIPVYNAEKFIAKCLDSVLNQSHQNLEIILVNDGSTDRSGLICDDYARKDTRVIALHKVNGGVSSARNAGLKMAKGKYIGFVDPDDWIEPGMFENLYQLIINSKADISACGYVTETLDGHLLNQSTKSNVIKYNRVEALNNILDTKGFQGFTCNKLFSAELLQKKPATLFDHDIHFGEDLLFCCETLLKCENIIYDPAPYYHYIIHESNATQSKYSPKKLTILIALERIINLLRNLEEVDINKFKNFYIFNNINLLMNGIKEKKCSRSIREHLKQNLYKYKLTNFNNVSIKSSYLIARVNIKLCYIVWVAYRLLMQRLGHITHV
jgi:glycosyltransferase involved in cell wall biosynthesis